MYETLFSRHDSAGTAKAAQRIFVSLLVAGHGHNSAETIKPLVQREWLLDALASDCFQLAYEWLRSGADRAQPVLC